MRMHAALVELLADVPDRVVVGRDARGPEVVDDLLGGAEHRQQRRLHRDDRAGEVLLAVLRRLAREPERLASLEAEAVERAGRGERLELLGVRARRAGTTSAMSRYGPRASRSATMRSATAVPIEETSASPSRTANAPSRRCSADRSGAVRSNRPTGGCAASVQLSHAGRSGGDLACAVERLTSSSPASTPDRRMSGRRISTPWRRASAVSVCGE